HESLLDLDGIDNPVLSLAEDAEPEEALQPRFCFLKKEDGENFGFLLRQEAGQSGHIVRQVTAGGLAHRRGLQNGDRILEVNGDYVEGMEHFKVNLCVTKCEFFSLQMLCLIAF
uniref:PDZ domain-containing protein n=1 Tax=Anolis carolinensis TaxID=28377 RepID=H9G628_ANOCA